MSGIASEGSETKRCSGCEQPKDLGEFYKNARAKDGLQSRCKPCRKSSNRLWSEKNREKTQAYCRAWYERNGDYVRNKRRARITPVEVRAAYQRRWRQNNPERRRDDRARYRARKASVATEIFTTTELHTHWANLGLNACFYCGAPWEHADHFIPLASGGAHSLDNLVPACAPCNLSKGAKDPFDWMTRLFAEPVEGDK